MGMLAQSARRAILTMCVGAAAGLNFYPTLVSFTPNITTRELTY